MRTIDLRGTAARDAAALVPRATEARDNALRVAGDLVSDVRDRGEAALREQAEKFDGVTGHALRVAHADIDNAVAALDAEVRDALERAISSPLNRAAVLDSLPRRHGRLEADRWIHNG